MDFSLYEEFPLFQGDLLVGLSPQPDELPHEATEEWQLPFSYNADGIDKGLQLKQPKQEVQITIDLNNVNLFDTKVDLLDLIQPEQTYLSPNQHYTSELNESSVNVSVEADELSRVSELLASDLQSLEYISSSQNISDHLPSDYSTLEYNATVLGDEDISEEVDSILSSNVELLGAAPVLSPVSTEDIDLVLQSEPTSPYSVETDTSAVQNSEISGFVESSLIENEDNDMVTVDSKYLREELMKPVLEVNVQPKTPTRSLRLPRQKARYEPYSPPDSPASFESRSQERKSQSKYEVKALDSKSRKKQQNKDAALRYRTKKKQEKCGIMDECSILEKKNEELNDKVDSMTREIQYLKDLLSEVYQAKSGVKSQSHLLRSK